MLAQEQGKLEEADPLLDLEEAVACFRKNDRINPIFICSLVELRREQGRLTEAEQELGSMVTG